MKLYIKASKTIEDYENMGVFNERQLEQIQEGLEDGLDVSWYADPKFTHSQMEKIRKCLKTGSDVSKCIDQIVNNQDGVNIDNSNKKSAKTAKKLSLNSIDFNKYYSISECFPRNVFDLDEYAGYSDEELIQVCEDNGFEYLGTLDACCENIYKSSRGDLDQALREIEFDFGNMVGCLPLASIGDWKTQQSIYKRWLKLNA